MPSNYLSWPSFLKHRELLSYVPTIKNTSFTSPSVGGNLAYLYEFWSQGGYPVYCVRDSLLEDMQQTDVGEKLDLFADIRLAMPSYVLFFPRKSVKSVSGDGGFIDYVIINHEEIVDHPDYKYVITWGAIDSKGCMFFSGKQIRRDGTLKSSYFTTDDEEQRKATLSLRNIVLQSILLLQYYPNIEEEMTSLPISPSKARGFTKPPEEDNSAADTLFPRWLGRECHVPKANATITGSGRSKSPHFRRGYWRRRNNKIIWVRPCAVNHDV